MPTSYWLMKAEPDSRVVKGKDVKFNVDDFEACKTTPWEGVRNHEAKNLMKAMKLKDKILFYHSNCKTPGIAGFAEVSKEAYPDYTAWDSSHPYYDEKSDSSNPRWYMVDATFERRANHFVSLALIKYLADHSASQPPEEVAYIGENGLAAIKSMALVKKGRLSVQHVSPEAWEAVTLLAEKGGWEDLNLAKSKATSAKAPASTEKPARAARGKAKKVDAGDKEEAKVEEKAEKAVNAATSGRKRKPVEEPEDAQPKRRSTRTKK